MLAAGLLLAGPGAARGAETTAGEEGSAPAGPDLAVEATVTPGSAAVGEPVTLNVRVTHPPGLVWEPRSVSRSHGPFDIEQVRGPETVRPKGAGGAGAGEEVTTEWTFSLTAFQLGELEIPPLELRATRPGEGGDGEVLTVATPARKVIIEARVTDPNAEAADIRTGFTLEPPGRLLQIVLAAAALAAGAALIWWLRGRRLPERPAPAPPPPPPGPPPRPAYDRALEELESLRRRGLPEKGRVKEFHILLAEIVKRYLGEVFAFDAVDRTTEEVLADLDLRARPTLGRETAGFLGRCDMVKFAEAPATPPECEELAGIARRILDMGRPASPPPPGHHAAPAQRARS